MDGDKKVNIVSSVSLKERISMWLLDEDGEDDVVRMEMNREELADLWGRPVRTPEDAIAGGKELLDNGAQNVLVSLGSEGAILLSPRGGWRLAAPCVQVQNTVGAGDSMLAGFLYGYDTIPGSGEEKLPAALRFGVAAGSATAACEGIAGKDAVLATLARTGQPERLW